MVSYAPALNGFVVQPMLCVSAVNPYLYGKVPILANVRELRRELSRLVACLQCPARSSIVAMAGSRCYLFENNDSFALRDLADLSKGPSAGKDKVFYTYSLLFSYAVNRCFTCSFLASDTPFLSSIRLICFIVSLSFFVVCLQSCQDL